MDYAAVADGLVDGPTAEVTAFPDGSVDDYYRVYDAARRPVESRAAFGERVAAGDTSSFAVEHRGTRPGGQAVNAAQGMAALGDDVTLYGFLDDRVFEGLGPRTVSMGEPARVAVYAFDDGSVMLSEDTEAMRRWTLSDLRDVAEDLPARLAADAVVCANWITFDRMTGALDSLASIAPPGAETFAFDPGDLTTADPGDVRSLRDALDRLDDPYDVVVSASDPEFDALADALDCGDDLSALREAVGVTALASHDADGATAATRDGATRVETITVDGGRQTGAGDQFLAGLAHARATGRDWERALAVGNLASSYYVRHDAHPMPRDLAEYVRSRE